MLEERCQECISRRMTNHRERCTSRFHLEQSIQVPTYFEEFQMWRILSLIQELQVLIQSRSMSSGPTRRTLNLVRALVQTQLEEPPIMAQTHLRNYRHQPFSRSHSMKLKTSSTKKFSILLQRSHENQTSTLERNLLFEPPSHYLKNTLKGYDLSTIP